jgi:hypothetical protein
MSKITFSQAMQGYLLAIGASHLSAHTVKDYVNTFNKFTTFLGEDILSKISHICTLNRSSLLRQQ